MYSLKKWMLPTISFAVFAYFWLAQNQLYMGAAIGVGALCLLINGTFVRGDFREGRLSRAFFGLVVVTPALFTLTVLAAKVVSLGQSTLDLPGTPSFEGSFIGEAKIVLILLALGLLAVGFWIGMRRGHK